MGFFDSIWDGVKSAGNAVGGGFKSVWNDGIKPAANFSWSKIMKPVADFSWNKVVKPGYENVVKPVANTAIATVTKIADRAEKIADIPLRLADTGLNLLGSPLLWIGGGIVAIFVLPKLLDKL